MIHNNVYMLALSEPARAAVIIVVLLAAADVVKGMALAAERLGVHRLAFDPDRRELVWRLLAGGVALTALGAGRAGQCPGLRSDDLRHDLGRPVRLQRHRIPL